MVFIHTSADFPQIDPLVIEIITLKVLIFITQETLHRSQNFGFSATVFGFE